MEQINAVTQILSLLFPSQALEDDALFIIFWLSGSLFSFPPLESFPKGNYCLAFYIIPNSQRENDTDEVIPKNIRDYTFRNKTIIQIFFL